MTAGRALRDVLARPGCAMAVGAHDPTVAKLVERAGAPVVYVGGSASSATLGGFADVGLTTFTEMRDRAAPVVAATALPTLCDVDTGYGNATNVARTIREYERLGAAGVHLEDQVAPKRCGQTSGAQLIPASEMQQKIYAAKAAQREDDLVLVARTDARQCEGVEGVIARGRAYIAAGADALFPEALLEPDEFRRVREAFDVPLVIDIPEWGRTPTIPLAELESYGWDLAIYAVSTLRVALGAVSAFLDDLVRLGTQEPWLERMMTRAELDEVLGLPAIRAEEERLATLFPEETV